jgi:ABC-type transport system involved in multi-copper enzyme maturation permease subunit
MKNNIFTIAHNTFRETMRDRILLAAVAVVFAIIGFSLFIGSISLEQNTRILVNFGVTAIYLLQIFVAIFIGSMLMYKEIEQKTFFLIIPKPIKRYEIILGKTLGLTVTTISVTLVATCALCVLLLFKGGGAFMVPIINSMILSTLESVVLILISIVFSSFTSPILSSLFTVVIYLAGHSSDSIRLAMTITHSELYAFILKLIYYILPNLDKFNTRNDIVYNYPISPLVMLYAVLYMFLYSSLLFLLANISFQKKEF